MMLGRNLCSYRNCLYLSGSYMQTVANTMEIKKKKKNTLRRNKILLVIEQKQSLKMRDEIPSTEIDVF